MSFSDKLKGQIGSTESGKPVLADGAESYSKDYTSEDHREAAEIHKKKAAEAQVSQRNAMLGRKTFDHRMLAALSAKQADHQDNAEYHQEQAEEVQKSKKTFKQKLEGGLADRKKPSDFSGFGPR